MKKRYIQVTLCIGLLSILSCNDSSIFEKEMYKNVFALVSSSESNIFSETLELTGGEVFGYIAASSGGTSAPDQDIKINLIEDDKQLNLYNWTNYDADEARYAKLLPVDKYNIDNYQIKIPAGERSGKTMIRVRPEGLSPDSIYFVSLKVSDYSSYELNENKSTILYRVMIKNDYASQAVESMYSMTGFLNLTPIGGSKKMHPLAWNRVRIMAGTQPYQADLGIINRASIVLEITHNNRVRIKPYKDIIVDQINDDEEYPNIFKTEVINGRKYNVFLLCYEYTMGITTQRIREELRMEVK